MFPCVQRVETRERERAELRKKEKLEVYWCKSYQKGNCSEKVLHMVQLKPDEPPVLVLHCCAYCLQKENRKQDHPESECNAKKGNN